jgi:hypothetical protein
MRAIARRDARRARQAHSAPNWPHVKHRLNVAPAPLGSARRAVVRGLRRPHTASARSWPSASPSGRPASPRDPPRQIVYGRATTRLLLQRRQESPAQILPCAQQQPFQWKPGKCVHPNDAAAFAQPAILKPPSALACCPSALARPMDRSNRSERLYDASRRGGCGTLLLYLPGEPGLSFSNYFFDLWS